MLLTIRRAVTYRGVTRPKYEMIRPNTRWHGSNTRWYDNSWGNYTHSAHIECNQRSYVSPFFPKMALMQIKNINVFFKIHMHMTNGTEEYLKNENPSAIPKSNPFSILNAYSLLRHRVSLGPLPNVLVNRL